MSNHIGLQRLEGLQPEFKSSIELLLSTLSDNGIDVCVVSGLRTIQQQNQLYAQGRTAKGQIVTNAKGGQSPHNFGTAVDLAPLDDKGGINWNDTVGFKLIGKIAKAQGLVWGGDFKSIVDLPHIESPTWRTIQADWKAGKVQAA
jgi:peptidoglycan L-alanyl-D-glutamate endopeptidase CwlK